MIIKINYPYKHSRALVVLLNPRTDVTAISLGLWGKKKYGVAFRIKVQTHISWDFDHSRIRKCRDTLYSLRSLKSAIMESMPVKLGQV